MKELPGVYRIDSLENIADCAAYGRGFASAVAFIRKGGLERLVSGRHEIDGSRVFVNVDEPDYVLPTARVPELHRRYFDIHLPMTDSEVIGLAPFDPSAEGSFDETKDVGFYRQPVEWLTVNPGEFAVTWPGTCAHAPACTNGTPHRARKLVFKVLADNC